jgi:DNA transformation protein and related proteins
MNLFDLPNFGPKSQQMLAQAGSTLSSSCANWVLHGLSCRSNMPVSLNLLWVMERALSGRHWQELAKPVLSNIEGYDRLSVLLQMEDVENERHG